MGLDALLARLSGSPATPYTPPENQVLQLHPPLSLGCTPAPPATHGKPNTESKTTALRRIDETPTPAPLLPSWCRADCPSLEIIKGVGPGCVRALANGPWREEWRKLGT